MYQFYLILPIVSSSGYDNNSWKQLLDIQLEIIQLEPKAKTLWSGACCAGEIYTHKTVTCLNMFDDRNAKLGKGTF